VGLGAFGAARKTSRLERVSSKAMAAIMYVKPGEGRPDASHAHQGVVPTIVRGGAVQVGFPPGRG
jgi:hypothetical protein